MLDMLSRTVVGRTAARTAWGLLFLTAAVLLGQEFRATVTGTIRDQQGAVVPGAQIQIRNLETNAKVSTATNESGVYTAPFLPPGHYAIEVQQQGFKRALRDNVELRVGDRVQMDFTLEIGAAVESISVSAQAELLETATASRGQVINEKSVQDLPLLGRNPFMLSTLSAGVQYTPSLASRSNRPFDNGGMDNFQINGGRGFTNEFLLDGVPDTNTETGGPNNLSFVPSPDATSEFKVQTNTYDAQYGRTGGGVVNVMLKSGTNQIHGALYEYFRNDKLNANTFESNLKGTEKGAFRWNQPGVEVDGPVYIPKVYDGRDKTFFMYSWEKIISSIPFPQTYRFPTALERAGDFSQTVQANNQPITIYDPLTTTLNTDGTYSRTAFAGNRIPANRLDPVAIKLLDYVPLPNVSGNSAFNFITDQNPRTDEYDQHIARVDQRIGDKHHVFTRYVRGNRHEVNSDAGFQHDASPWYTHWRTNQGGNLDVTSTLSPSLVLNFRYGYIRHQFAIARYGDLFDPSQLGFPASLVSQLPRPFFPRIEFRDTEYTNFGNTGSQFTFSDTHSIAETASKVIASHTLKFGGEFRLLLNNQQNPTSSMGVFRFDRSFTQRNPLAGDAASGNPYASFMLGYPYEGNIPYNVAPAFRNHYWALFLQDDWRVSRRLTVNAGLRWDYESPISERYNQQNRGFDPNAPSPIQAPGLQLKGGLLFTSPDHPLPYHRDLNNFQPRIGVAYQLRSTTVLRGGYGLFYLPTFDTGFTNGFSTTTPFVASIDNGITPANVLSNPYPGGVSRPTGSSLGLATQLGAPFTVGDYSRDIPRVHQFSLGIQQELPFRLVLDVAYVGSRTFNLNTARNINDITAQQLALGSALNTLVPNPMQGLIPGNAAYNGPTIAQRQLLRPFPQFGDITLDRTSIGRAWYNALQLRIEKRYSSGLHFLASYTYSKTLEAVDYLNAQDGQGNMARVVTAQDTPHKLVLSGGYELPFFKSGPAIARYVLGGWQMNTIVTIQSGLPVSTPGNAVSTGVSPAIDNPTNARWFNTCTINRQGKRQNCASDSEPVAFIVQAPFTLRTLSTRFSEIRTQRPPQVDFSLFKSIPIHERLRLQFRAEAFNLTNTPWFGTPNLNINAAQFGTVTPSQANDPRNVQLAMKLMF